MAVNRYDVPADFSYQPLPFEDVLRAGALKQKQQDIARQELDLLGKPFNALEQDTERAKAIKQEVDAKLDELSGSDLTNPINRQKLHNLRRDLINRYGPQGDIGVIEANYNTAQTYKKHIIDKAKDLGWSENQLRQHLQDVDKSFSGTIGEEGRFNYYQTPGLANYVNPNDWVSKALKDVESDTGVVGLSRYGSLNAVTDAWKHGKIETKTYNKIVNALANRAAGDTALLNSLEQEGRFLGIQGNKNFISSVDKDGNIILNPNTTFGNILGGGASGAAFRKADMDYMQVDDPLALEKAKKEIYDEKPNMPIVPGEITNNDNFLPEELKGVFNKDGSINWNFSNNTGGLKRAKPGTDFTMGAMLPLEFDTKSGKTGIEIKKAVELAKRFNLPMTNEAGKIDSEVILTNVYNYLKNNSVNASRNTMLDEDVAVNFTNYLKGGKDEASNLTGNDIKIQGEHDAFIPGSQFDQDKFDKNSIVIRDYDWTETPGTKLGVVKNKDGEEVQFKVRTRNENEKAHFKVPYQMNNDFKDYMTSTDYSIKDNTGLSDSDAIAQGNQIINSLSGRMDFNKNVKVISRKMDKAKNLVTTQVVDNTDPYNPNVVIIESVVSPDGSLKSNNVYRNLDEYKSRVTSDWFNSAYGQSFKRDVKVPKETFEGR